MTLRPPYRLAAETISDGDGVVVAQLLVEDDAVGRAMAEGLNAAARRESHRPVVLPGGESVSYRCDCGCEW